MKKLRIAIAGAGNIAQNAHLPVYQEMSDIELVAICDLNLARAQETAKKYGIPHAFTTAKEMLDAVQCDVVDICVWNGSHAEIALAACEKGVHILCEKPMALNNEHALRMQEAVEKAGVLFMMAMPRRFSSEAVYLRQMIEDGELGKVYLAKTTMLRRRGTPLGWFTDTKKSGGGPVIDIGVHAIDCAWFLMGRPNPVRVSSVISYAIGNYDTKGVSRWVALDSDVTAFDTEDSAAGIIHFDNGAALMFDVSWAINMENTDFTQVYGGNGGANINVSSGNDPKHPIAFFSESHQYLTDVSPTVPPINMFENEIKYFLSCVREGKKPDPGVADGVMMMKMLMGIYESAKLGKEVSL